MTQIRALTPTDLPDVLALWRAVPEVELNDSDTPEHLTRYLARNPESRPVALADETIVGAVPYCHNRCGHDGRRGYSHLAVAAPYRNQGLGRALVAYCVAHLARVGIDRCNVFVLPNNPSARAFWERMAFQEKPWPLLQRRFGAH